MAGTEDDRTTGLSLPAQVAIGGLAVLGTIVAIQWIFGALFGLIRLLLVIVVVAAIGWLLLSRSRR